jgi:phenylacetate-CoA ligase
VNLFPTQIEELILRTPALAPHFQLQLSRSGRLDVLTVHVERRPDADAAAAQAAGAELVAAIKASIGVTVATRIGDPDTVERSVGKMRRVVDERGDPPRF